MYKRQDLLYSGNVDAFALVSSDSDFTSLATRLRASGKTVYGLGLRKTPESLRRAVDRFIFLEDLDDAPADDHREEQADTGSPSTRRVPDLRRLLERAITSTSHDDGWASLSSVANHVIRVEPSFSVKDYDASKLVDLVRAQSYVDVDQPESGPVRVRLAVKEAPKKSSTEKSSTTRSNTRKAAEKPAAEKPAAEKAPSEAPVPEKAPAKKAATKKATTTRTRKRTTVTQTPAAEPATETAAQATPEPTPEAAPEPAGKPQVTTRKRSSRSAKPL